MPNSSNSPNESTRDNESQPNNKNVLDAQSIAKPQESHSLRRLLKFQVKLAIDALRDILLSPVSIICCVLDYFENKSGNNSYFEKLMVFGRHTERRINLFEQHQENEVTVDSMMNKVEDIIVGEYQNKNISKKTLSAIQQALNKEQTSKKTKD